MCIHSPGGEAWRTVYTGLSYGEHVAARARRKMDQVSRKWGPGLKANEGNVSATEPSRTLNVVEVGRHWFATTLVSSLRGFLTGSWLPFVPPDPTTLAGRLAAFETRAKIWKNRRKIFRGRLSERKRRPSRLTSLSSSLVSDGERAGRSSDLSAPRR